MTSNERHEFERHNYTQAITGTYWGATSLKHSSHILETYI